MKTIVFDLDNTLIKWKLEYRDLIKAIDSNLDYESINSAIECYEDSHLIYTKESLLEHINTLCNTNLEIEFIDKLVTIQGICFDKDDELVDTIKYLSNKYELVVLTNWFRETQIARLKGAKIYDYFKFVSCGDERNIKPFDGSFDIILDNYNPSDCIMIGDSIRKDIEPAIKLGMDAIFVNNDNIETKYKSINKISELKEML